MFLHRINNEKVISEYKKNILNSDFDVSDEYFKDATIVGVVFYDVYTNKQLTRLLKRLYRIKSKQNTDLTLKISLKKPYLHTRNYLSSSLDSTYTCWLAKLNFQHDPIISHIDAIFTQINNVEAVVSYTCYLKWMNCDSNAINNFVKENIGLLLKCKHFPSEIKSESLSKDDLRNVNMNLFYLILQEKVKMYFNLNYGNDFQLPRLSKICYEERNDALIKFLKDNDDYETYDNYNHEIAYLVSRDTVNTYGIDITEIVFRKVAVPNNLLNLFTNYRMEAYYRFFYNIERTLLERQLNEFNNSYCKYLSSNKLFWYYERLEKTQERFLYNNKVEIKDKCNLRGYSQNSNKYFIQKDVLEKKFNIVYRSYYDRLSPFYVRGYNQVILVITALTLLVAVITLFKN